MLAFQSGVEGAFDRIVALYRLSVLRFLRRTVRDEDRAEDLAQEVFIRVYRSRDRYQPTATFRTWVFTIAHHLALNEIRAVRRRRRVFYEEIGRSSHSSEYTDPAESLAAMPDRNVVAPDAELQARELEAVLARLVAELPENQRLAIELQRTETFSYVEIASMLDVSVMAIKSLLVRARTTLRLGVERYLEGLPPAGEGNENAM